MLQVRTLLDWFTGPAGKEISESSSERSSVLKVGKISWTTSKCYSRGKCLRLRRAMKPPVEHSSKNSSGSPLRKTHTVQTRES